MVKQMIGKFVVLQVRKCAIVLLLEIKMRHITCEYDDKWQKD